MYDAVRLDLTRAEYDALMAALERPVPHGNPYGPRYPTLRAADLGAAIDKLEAAGRSRLSVA